ncbi:MAG: hypothetical protein ACE5HX_15200, partial [bacterium]
KYLKPGEIPVAQGEIIAFSGQTGIGAPHLHFEIRDSGNRPINPLSKGYHLPDRVPPIITKVSLSPLDAEAEVNGDYKPIIVIPHWSKPGEYMISETVHIWGNVGLAVSCYDRDSSSLNRYGVYRLKLYVDDVLRFQYSYDELSFRENRMVELERDYRLSRRGFGRFQKLYKDKYNFKSNYSPNKTWAGVLKSAALEAKPKLLSKSLMENTIHKNDFQTGLLFPGPHTYKIEVSDYFGNVSTVHGEVQVGAAYHIAPLISEDENGMLNLQNVITYDLRKVENLDAFVLQGNRWRSIPFESSENSAYIDETGGEGPESESYDSEHVFLLKKPPANPLILKLVGHDQFNAESYPYFYLESQPMPTSNLPQLRVQYDFYDEYLRLDMQSNTILRDIPKVVLYPGRRDSVLINLHQIDLKNYIGRINYDKLTGSVHLLKIIAPNFNGDEFINWQQFVAKKINPPKTKSLYSDDRQFWVNFWSGSVYRPIYGRVIMDSLTVIKDMKIVGQIYDAEPQDVPLNAGALVNFRYPPDQIHTEQLGVYYKTFKGKWEFIDNKLDVKKGTVTAKVFSLEKFALIRDEEPPEITEVRPGYQAHLKTNKPRISARIRDRLSGINSENDIVIRLNGERLIAEYDPERNRIFYQFNKPLPKGRYEVTVWVQDRSKNNAFRKSIFWID